MSNTTGVTKYIVWRRNDGYVHASANTAPSGWMLDDYVVSFEILGTYDNWPEAYERISKERNLKTTLA